MRKNFLTFSENFDIIFIVNEKRNEKIEVHSEVLYFILQGAVAIVATSMRDKDNIPPRGVSWVAPNCYQKV